MAHGTFIATANELHGMFPPLLLPPLLSSLLPPSHTQKKERELFITGIFPARNLFFITFLNKFHKIAAGENYSRYSFILIQKHKGRNCNDFVEDGILPRTQTGPPNLLKHKRTRETLSSHSFGRESSFPRFSLRRGVPAVSG